VLRSYTYSYAGLLDQAAYSGRTATNTWDADSDRVGLVMNGTTYSFVFDTMAGIPAVIVEGDSIVCCGNAVFPPGIRRCTDQFRQHMKGGTTWKAVVGSCSA